MNRIAGVLIDVLLVISLIATVWVVNPSAILAAEASRPTLSAVLASSPPKIDGRLNEEVWREGRVHQVVEDRVRAPGGLTGIPLADA